jgi:hypothetical protein
LNFIYTQVDFFERSFIMIINKRSRIKTIYQICYLLGVLSITASLALSLVNFQVKALPIQPQNSQYNCSGFDLKQDGQPGTTFDYRGSVSISEDSRTASWSANEGWVISAVCVKGGSPENSNSDGYYHEWSYPDFSSWSPEEGEPDVSHAAVKFEEAVPTETPVTPTPVTPTPDTPTPVTPTPDTPTPVTPTPDTPTPVTPTPDTPTPVTPTPDTPTPVTPTPDTPTPVTPTPDTPTPVTPTPQEPTPTPQEPTNTPVTPTSQVPTSTPVEPTPGEPTPTQPTETLITPIIPVTGETPTPQPQEPTKIPPTNVPTLAAPIGTNSPSVLIPVTGGDLTPASPIETAQKIILNFGFALIGLGLILQGIRRRIS